jgi:hypothetical protein
MVRRPEPGIVHDDCGEPSLRPHSGIKHQPVHHPRLTERACALDKRVSIPGHDKSPMTVTWGSAIRMRNLGGLDRC